MLILLSSALLVGVVHTLLGPDHYLPFIVLAKARKWSMIKTTVVTFLCGVGHILSAVILGMIAIAIGMTLSKLNFIESFRGEIAAWLLIGFGFAYFIWGLRRAIRNKKYRYLYEHFDDIKYMHNNDRKSFKELTPWVLFMIFIFGPCEPLIPLIMYPAVQKSLLNVFLVTLIFGFGTIFVMVFIVLASLYGTKKLEQLMIFKNYGNAFAGFVICSCGLAIKFLGV